MPPDDRDAAGDVRDPRRFAEHDRFVRTLLQRLVGDPHLAEDLAQETWLAALRQSAAATFLRRAWLGTVARNFALQSIRGGARRCARESAVARPIVQHDAHGVRDGDESRRLLAAVEELEEPYRTAIRLRFFDDLPPTLIAEQLQLPVETVRTRLKRALARVRLRMVAPATGTTDTP